MSLDLLFQRLCVFGFRIEDDIAAGNERLDAREANTFEQTAKIIHFHGVAANINRAQLITTRLLVNKGFSVSAYSHFLAKDPPSAKGAACNVRARVGGSSRGRRGDGMRAGHRVNLRGSITRYPDYSGFCTRPGF